MKQAMLQVSRPGVRRSGGPALRRMARMLSSAALSAAALWTVSVVGGATSATAAAEELSRETIPLMLLRYERGDYFDGEALPLPTALALRATPLLRPSALPATAARDDAVEDAGNSGTESTQADVPGGETENEMPDAPSQEPPEEPSDADNGVPARTLRPTGSEGYLTLGNVYVHNASNAALTAEELSFDYPATLPAEGPQVLIVHTHGSEAYTMPPGEEYEPSDDHRTIDKAYSVVRVGDEMARVLEEAGLSVVHDRELYDYPSYSGAYNRSLAAIEAWRQRYPSITFILDVHRDAIADASGGQYKLVTDGEENAAQLEFVVGSDGGGAEHPHWRDNLRLACAVQSTLLGEHPTLMRPITVRNSRYNQQVTSGTLLIEVGAAGNSLSEALRAARLFAAGYAKTLLS